jgi:hypothetical protein
MAGLPDAICGIPDAHSSAITLSGAQFAITILRRPVRSLISEPVC